MAPLDWCLGIVSDTESSVLGDSYVSTIAPEHYALWVGLAYDSAKTKKEK